MKRLRRTFLNEYLVKNFSDQNIQRRHLFADAKIPGKGIITLEMHRTIHHSSIILRLKTESGDLLTRSYKTRDAIIADPPENITDEGIAERFWGKEDVDPRLRDEHKIVESRVENSNKMLIDLKNEKGNRILRTMDLDRLVGSSLPVTNFGYDGKKVYQNVENFLEVFKGNYSEDILPTNLDYGYYRKSTLPCVMPFGIMCINAFEGNSNNYNDALNSFQNGVTGTQRNYNLTNTEDYKVATVENLVSGESLTLFYNNYEVKTSRKFAFYGITKDHGKISIRLNSTGNHIPDANFSKIPEAVDALNYFKVDKELYWLNRARNENTIVPEILCKEITDYVVELYRVLIAK
jgi:hypothetical protein